MLSFTEMIHHYYDLKNRIDSILLIHENLYKGDDFKHIDIGIYLTELLNLIIDTFSNNYISLNIDISDVHLESDKAIPLGFITTELTTNTLKYAFSDNENGEIKIAMAEHKGYYTFTFSNNGKLLPPNIDFENPTSLGMQIVNGLVEQINGTLKIYNDDEVKFEIVFPV